jgi:hypothetical protein
MKVVQGGKRKSIFRVLVLRITTILISIPPATFFGREIKNDKLVPIMMTRPSKASIYKPVSCKCSKSRCLGACSCAKAQLKCYIACTCNGKEAKCDRLEFEHFSDSE